MKEIVLPARALKRANGNSFSGSTVNTLEGESKREISHKIPERRLAIVARGVAACEMRGNNYYTLC